MKQVLNIPFTCRIAQWSDWPGSYKVPGTPVTARQEIWREKIDITECSFVSLYEISTLGSLEHPKYGRALAKGSRKKGAIKEVLKAVLLKKKELFKASMALLFKKITFCVASLTNTHLFLFEG